MVQKSTDYNHDDCVCYTKNSPAKSTEELSIEERKMYTIINNMPIAANIIDKDLNIIECNGEALRLFEMRDVYEYNEKFQDLSPHLQPDGIPSAEKAITMYKKALETGYVRFEWMHQKISGDLIPCDIILVRFGSGDETSVLTYITDKREYYKLEQRLKAMLDASPILCALFDENGNIIEANQAAADMFGLPNKQVYLERILDLQPEYQPDGSLTREKMLKLLKQVIETGNSTVFEWMHCTLDKKTMIPCEVTLERICLSDKNVVIAYARDIKEEYKVKEMQNVERQRLQAMLDSSPLVCALFDGNHNALSVNQKVEILFEIPDKQMYLDDVTRFMPEYQPDGSKSVEKSYAMLRAAFESGYQRYEWMYQTLDGKPLPCEEVVELISLGDRDLALVYTRDMREQKEMLAKLEDAIASEQAANSAKTKFLSNMSHEIRTPMNSVLGIAEIQLQKDTHPPDTEEAFLRIYNSSNLLLSIINDILDLSKVEAGKMEIVPHVYETASMIVDTVQLNLMYIGSKRIEFKLSVDERLPAYLIGDEIRVKQILNNLLSNAFKYTTEGLVSLSFGLEGSAEADTIMLVAKVSDTGQGMNRQQIESMFDEFARFNLQSNRAIEGSGLGLVIANQLVQLMDGDIFVESKLGQGSTFTLRLPQKRKNRDILGAEVAAGLQNLEDTQKSLKRISKLNREPMPYGRVLVVDDVESNLYVAKGFLLPYKIAVETVNSGEMAISRIEDGEVYDIIFMDHMMPDMDGMQTTEIIRGMGYKHPIVALTANAFSDSVKMFMDNGFSGFISKPVDLNQLDKQLLRFIRDKQPPEVIEKARLAKNAALADTELGLSEMLMNSFLRDAERALDVLKELGGDNLKPYVVQTHAMKSALYNINRHELSKEANMLEQAGRAGDVQTIKDATPHFLARLKEVIKELESSKVQNEPDEDEDLAFLKSQMLLIYEACETYDIEEARAAINALNQKACSNQTKKLLSEIADHLLSGGYEEARELAKHAADK